MGYKMDLKYILGFKVQIEFSLITVYKYCKAAR